LERDTVTVLYGDSDTYKSFLAIDLGLSVAHGVDFAGFRVHQGAVFYVCGEGQGGIGRRVEAWHIARKVHEHDAPFFVSELPAALMDDGNACALAQGIGFRIADLGRDDPALIVIDTLSQNFGDGDESKNADVSTFLSNINVHLRARYRCAVIIIHHVGHGDKDRERGAYAIRGNADARILVQRRKEPMTVEMTCRKMKDGPSFDPLWFRGRIVVLPDLFDSEGEPQTSLVLERVEGGTKDDNLSRQQWHLYDLIKDCLQSKEAQLPSACQDAPNPPTQGQLGCPKDKLREYVLAQGGLSGSGKPDTERQAFKRGLDELQHTGRIVIHKDWIWLPDNQDKAGQDADVRSGLALDGPDGPDNPL
jgi:hypothetical protein